MLQALTRGIDLILRLMARNPARAEICAAGAAYEHLHRQQCTTAGRSCS
ncbi:hypothetical protein HBN54_003895 [Hymenobacter sp. 1B]|uniref:Uncharacterized protein n=1 Tax=Hymenobacter artigasi TaxID=2719616 RepID=A0ABX1HLZ5_9BACT|nr:hypothetical protein [Hymenobacter artigasi]